jgi:methanogenic corrinoid protein MtbC1
VGHEHLATEQIESWLRRQTSSPGTGSAVVIGCGPEDVHRVGVDAFSVLLARRGVSTVVLGPLVPVADLVAAVETTRARAAVVASHMKTTRRAAVASLRALHTRTDVQLFYGGNGFITASGRKGVPGTYLGEDLVAAADQVAHQLAQAG